ncbi:protein CIP2A [Thalassophryne amazonica]|uniref:protein CIP2A n=1 Tax=Thalassophryne amazonica TaxID=390379 RepID=UPI001472578B|nr:protein CIP2A [Thalassophryne amazonica]XP_034023752.1 protein CIP2A [Thalassophryne amazonica]
MDMTTCLKSLLLAIHQYRDNRTVQNTARLHQRVEEVSGLKCDQLLCSGQVLPSECVSRLVELAGNPNTSPALTSSIISLLTQLACDDNSWKMLHSSYNLTNSLAFVIHCHNTTPGEPLVLQCLQVLQKLTYNTRIFQCTNNIQKLIAFLMTNIQSNNDDIITACLSLMANLCRDNQSVQSYIKSLDNVKLFYRTLINFLAHNSLTVVVFTLSILVSLTLNEKVGEKLFDANNIHQTFQLVFNIIVNGDGTLTQKYSVDLLIDLLKSPKIANYLTRYEHFSVCVSQVMGLLHSKDSESAAKLLELVLAMCSISDLRLQLCELVFQRAGLKLRTAKCRQAAGLDRVSSEECGLALVQWLNSSVEGAEACAVQVLQLLEELLKEALGGDGVSECVLSFVEMLLPFLLGLLKGLDPAQGEAHLRKCCRCIIQVTSLLLVLCTQGSTRSLVSCQVSAQLFLSQGETLLSCCHSNSRLTCSPPVSDGDLSQLCAEALLKTLELMSKLRQQVQDMETSFYRLLQDQRIVTPLSLALTSYHRERVQTGLALLFEATPLPDFPSLILGESMAANNGYHQRQTLFVKRTAVQEVPPPRTNSSTLDSSSGSSRSVHSLVEKIQSGLELQEQLEGRRVSEIIGVYEQKLSAFAAKESRLQDLLESKALDLCQANRLISHYHFQQAQEEAETHKLGCLLKEAEHRREELQAELANQVLEVERSKTDIKELLQHNTRLQQDSEDHQTLKGSYNTLLNRFNEAERLLKDQQTVHTLLVKQTDALKKNHEALRQQHDKMISVLEEKEHTITSLMSDLQQKDTDIAGLQGELRAEEKKGKEKDKEKRELEEMVDVLRKELNKTEQARKDASIRASSLELQKGQLEAKLRQKEEELKKHSAMIAMIHSLSSGKIKSDVSLS